MPVEYVSGDLLANQLEAHLIAIGCNCLGSLSTPIQYAIGEQYFDFWHGYRSLCEVKPREFNLGTCYVWAGSPDLEDVPAIAALGVQERPLDRGSYDGVSAALEALRDEADNNWAEVIAMPLPGVGPEDGNLDPERVKVLIEAVFDQWEGMVYVYEAVYFEDND